ncbi:MAG: TerB family tellurite resistance protein [Candidatus Sericytochromatia bacterium]
MIYDIHSLMRRYDIAPDDEPKVLDYLKALKWIIGADGEIADAEWEALVRWMQRMHISEALVTEISSFDFRKARLEDILPELKPGGFQARRLLRNAIEIARADGHFATEEHEAVHKAARLLGVDNDTVNMIEGLVEMEEAVTKMRQALVGE